jgi:hypothetical protein
MGLTAEVELSLRDAGLIDFYDANEDAFEEVTERSFEFAANQVAQIGLPLRRDDVGTFLIPALRTNEPLREELGRKKLRQRYWYERFADLILDRKFDELVRRHNAE